MDSPRTEGLWHHVYWLPRGSTWEDVPVKPSELRTALLLAVFIAFFRVFYESVVGIGLGWVFGFVAEPRRLLWCHVRGGFMENTRSKRVLETFWRFSAYAFLLGFGIYALYDKPWLYDLHQGYIGYPRHVLDDVIYWYYMIECGFYVSLLAALPFDVRRSDFTQMLIHHVVTIGLITISWTINLTRLGTLVLISHDVSDVFLELGKLARYDKRRQNLCNAMFVVLFISWIASRLIYFPLVVYTGVNDGLNLIQPDYEIFNLSQKPYAPRIIMFFLASLIVLHVFWTYLILRIVLKTLRDGEAADIRSDAEDSNDKLSPSTKAPTKEKRLKTRRELDKLKKSQ